MRHWSLRPLPDAAPSVKPLAALEPSGDSAAMRLVFVTAAALTALVGLAGCPTPGSPKGPAPLYEDPPAPSWLDAGATTDSSAAAPSSRLP